MAVDYGDVRTGLAVSDESATLAGEAWTVLERDRDAVAGAIAAAAAARGVKTIVVGHPRNMDGSVGPRAQKSESLAEFLRGLCDIEVVLWDERMTTVSAHRVLSDAGKFGKKRKNAVDAVAASLILENYLQYLKMQNS